MTEQADDILDGLYCAECGELIDGDDWGFPRLCEWCEDWDDEDDLI